MTTNDLRERVVAELRLLLTGTVVEWGDDTCGDEAVITGSLCVWAPEVARPLGLNWVWDIADAVPDDGELGPLSIVVSSEGDGWRPEQLSEVLREWVVVHAGRTDLTFRYNPELLPDLVDRLRDRAEQTGDDDPAVQSEDGALHSVSPTTPPTAGRCSRAAASSPRPGSGARRARSRRRDERRGVRRRVGPRDLLLKPRPTVAVTSTAWGPASCAPTSA